MKRYMTIFFFVSILLQSCQLSETDIQQQSWKYSGGLNIADWIDFKQPKFSLSNDTIYLNGHPAAMVVESKVNIWESKNSLTIQSFENSEKGVYIQK